MLLDVTSLLAALLLTTSEMTSSGGPAPSSAEPCHLDLRMSGQVAWRGLYGRGYEPSSGGALEQADVSVSHEGEACRWFMTGERPGGGAFLIAAGGQKIAYDLLQAPNGRSILSDDVQGTSFSRVPGEFAKGSGSQTVPLFVSIPPGQLARAGAYSAQSVIRLYRVGDGAPELVAQAPLNVSTAVPAVLSVSSRDFAPGALGGTVDLGDLERGASKSVGFDVSANSDVSVTFHSAGGGVLRHQYGAPGVPYRLSAGGRNVPLGTGASLQRFVASPGTPLGLDLLIEVDPRPAAAGLYRDELVVTFRAEG